MRDFEESTLWRVSEFERVRELNGGSGFVGLGRRTVLPTTLMAELQRLDGVGGGGTDLLEVVAACVRHREPALLLLDYEGLVWPVTLFPEQQLYHSPRDLADAAPDALGQLALIGAEPPGVRPPGHWMHERVAQTAHYRPLAPLLWQLALEGPRANLLAEISGTAAYRALRDPAEDGVELSGALRPAAQRLRRETVSLRDIAGWPGMSVARASRLLNGLYLSASLLATRAHPAARAEPRELWRGGKPGR